MNNRLTIHPFVVFVVGLFMLTGGLTWLTVIVKGQKAERGTAQWGIPIRDWAGTDAVHVVDTSGVCLYIVSWGNENSPAIAAIPKTQLPQGAGCQ